MVLISFLPYFCISYSNPGYQFIMRLILTRHGETIENKAGILQGHIDGTLSEEGILQAQALAERLKNEKLDKIYSSDLGRAAATTQIIDRYHPDTPVEYTQSLRERYFGEFQGMKRKDCGWDKNDPHATCPEPETGESFRDVYLRAAETIKSLSSRHKSDNILLVTHGFIGKIMTAIITGVPPSGINAADSLKNTSVSIFESDAHGNLKTVILDSVEHLKNG